MANTVNINSGGTTTSVSCTKNVSAMHKQSTINISVYTYSMIDCVKILLLLVREDEVWISTGFSSWSNEVWELSGEEGVKGANGKESVKEEGFVGREL